MVLDRHLHGRFVSLCIANENFPLMSFKETLHWTELNWIEVLFTLSLSWTRHGQGCQGHSEEFMSAARLTLWSLCACVKCVGRRSLATKVRVSRTVRWGNKRSSCRTWAMLFFTSEGVQGLPLMSISPDFLVPPSSRHVIMSSRDVFPQPVEAKAETSKERPYNGAIYAVFVWCWTTFILWSVLRWLQTNVFLLQEFKK